MEELCAKSPVDDSDLQEKIERFIDDRSIETVTGIRRMGRDNLVDFIAGMCKDRGLSCSIFPETSGRIVIFRHWSDMKGPADELLSSDPELDILFGQDLCHQVPAVVRYNIRKG